MSGLAEDLRLLPHSWRGDLVAGLTVGVVALPLALAFGLSAGVGVAAGLVTAVVAGIVGALAGGSSVQVSGPTGAMVVVLAPVVAVHGPGALPVLCLLAGVVLIIGGALRLGRLVSMIPWPVIEGFTLGIAVIIAAQQIPLALGATSTRGGNALLVAARSISDATITRALPALALVGIVVAVMLVLPRLVPRIPASMVAIVASGVVGWLLLPQVPSIGLLPRSFPVPHWQLPDPATLQALLPAAVTIAALAAIESLLSARVAESMTGPAGPPGSSLRPDRELLGQGVATVAAGLLGGMPATGAIARTAVNVRSGGRTRLAAVTHGLLLLVLVVVGSGLVSHLPLAALAGVLLVTAARMPAWSMIGSVLRSGRAAVVTFVVTALVTVSVDLVVAVGIGIAVAAVLVLRSMAHSAGVHREELPGPAQPGDERIALFRVDGSLFFGVADRLVSRISEHAGVDVIVLRLSQVQLMDATGAHQLDELVGALQDRGTTVIIKGVRAEHRELLRRAGAFDTLRHPRHLQSELEPAIEDARDHVRRLVGGIRTPD